MYFGGLSAGNGSLSLSNKLITKLKEKGENIVSEIVINSLSKIYYLFFYRSKNWSIETNNFKYTCVCV